MVCQAMEVRWITYGIQLWCFALFIVVSDIQGCSALNSEGLVLLDFLSRVDYDPYGVLTNWNFDDNDPCRWSGVQCEDGRVQMLNLNGLSLEGELTPDLGRLSYLRSLVLHDNHFVGAIPKEIGLLKMLEVLDLRNNFFNGTIPSEIGELQSLKRLLLCNNKFEGEFPVELGKLNQLSELQFDDNLSCSASSGSRCINRKLGHCIWQSNLKQPKRADSFTIPIKSTLLRYLNVLPLLKSGRSTLHCPADNCCDNLPGVPTITGVPNVEKPSNFLRRGLLEQYSSNLVAVSANGRSPNEQINSLPIPITRSSGSFPAVPNGMEGRVKLPASPPVGSRTSPPQQNSTSNPDSPSPGSANKSSDQNLSSEASGNTWKYVGAFSGASFLVIVAAALFFMCRNPPVPAIGPWKTGLSGQLRKAFVTGVPKLNRAELETACEDFSNIISSVEGCMIFKGTLSSGVEIAVASTSISSAKDWSKRSELAYRKKIDSLSRVNHKNFVNLIGYCEEEEPFTRMMVFEYASNGSLFEHLHVKEMEHLDWGARMRIIMGTAYCLQHMHELIPPVAHINLDSKAIILTDDYAAKIVEYNFWRELATTSKISGENELEHSEIPPLVDSESNVHSFGVLMLEIISGKLRYSDEHGPLDKWASQCLNDKRSISYLIDPTLKSVKDNEVDILCEVIQDCIHQNVRKRPTMKEVTTKLREVVAISPDAATPRVSPLWWAELEILSAEAA